MHANAIKAPSRRAREVARDAVDFLKRQVGRAILFFVDLFVLAFGRDVDFAEAEWLDGPSEPGDVVGPEAHLRVAKRRELDVWEYPDGGLLAEFDDLDSPSFDAALIDERIHHFYEATAAHNVSVAANWRGPIAPLARFVIGMAGPAADNLNLPLNPEELAAGLDSKIISLVDPVGDDNWTCWLRRKRSGEVVYSGFYGLADVPEHYGKCVKTVFPIPHGHITVVLEPTHHRDGGLDLRSEGRGWGDAGFYVCRRLDGGRARVVKLPLGESIRVFLDERDELRTDHKFAFLGSEFLRLDYRLHAKSVV